MTVTANQCNARQSNALLRPYNMRNPLALVTPREIGDTELFTIFIDRERNFSRPWVIQLIKRRCMGRRIVIWRRECLVRTAELPIIAAQALKTKLLGLWERTVDGLTNGAAPEWPGFGWSARGGAPSAPP